MNRKNTKIWLSLLVSCACLWTLELNAQPSISEGDVNYYLQAIKGVRVGEPLITFKTYSCDKMPAATHADFVEYEYVGKTSHEALPLPGSAEHTVTQYSRKAEQTYLVIPADNQANMVCRRESEKGRFFRTVVMSKQLEEEERQFKQGLLDYINNLLSAPSPTAEDDIAQIFANLKHGDPLGGRSDSASPDDDPWGTHGDFLGGGPRKPYDDHGSFGDSGQDDSSPHSMMNQLLKAEQLFGSAGSHGLVLEETVGFGSLASEKESKPKKKKVTYVTQSPPTSDESNSQTIQVTANPAHTNINIIQLALMLVGIPVSDQMDFNLLNIGDMNSAEIENFANIIQNLAQNAPELINDGVIEVVGENADTVVNLLLELEGQLQNFGSIVSEWETDEHETPTLATIRQNRRMLIGPALITQISGTSQFFVPGGNEQERSILLNVLLGIEPPPPPESPSHLGETIDELTLAVDAGDIPSERIERLRKKIAFLRQLLATGDAEKDDREKVLEHLDALTDALDRFEVRLHGESPEEAASSTFEEQVNSLNRQVVVLNRMIAVKEKELEEAVPGSAWAQILGTRIENLTAQRDMTSEELLQRIKQKAQQQNPDATPEPTDMETDGSKEKTTFDKSALKDQKGSTGGRGNGRDRNGQDEDDTPLRRGGGDRGQGPPEGGARVVNMAKNPSQRTMKELVMWVAKNLENLNTGNESRARGAEKTVRMIFADIVKSPESIETLQRLIHEFLQKEYPADADRLLEEARRSLDGEELEIPENIARYIRVMMRIKRTLRLSMMLLEENIISKEDLERVKQEYSVVLGETFRAIDSVTFVDHPEWVLSAVHNGRELLDEEGNRELMMARIKDTDFAQLTDPEGEEEAAPSESQLASIWAAFMRDASRTPYSLTYVGGTAQGSVFRVFRNYPLFNAKKQWADMLVRFPDHSGVQKISVEGGVGDTATLFFANNPRIITLLTKLINQNTLNLIKNIMFGGTGGASAGGGFGEEDGLLTQMGLEQMHGTNELHNDLSASEVQVTVYSNGALRIEYRVMFDRWAVHRKSTQAERFKGDFVMTVAMEFDSSGRRKRAEFKYQGDVEEAELERARVQRRALNQKELAETEAQKKLEEEKARAKDVEKLERWLKELLFEKSYKPQKTGVGQTTTRKNNWQTLDAFEKVTLDMSTPEGWHYHPDVIALSGMFKNYMDVLKLMRKLDFYTDGRYKNYQKGLKRMQERFERAFQLYLERHYQAYTELRSRRLDTDTPNLERVFSQYVEFQQQFLAGGATIAQLGKHLMPGLFPGMTQLVSVRGQLEERIPACEERYEDVFGHTGVLSQERSRLLNDRVLRLPGDVMALVDQHLPIIIRGSQVEALLMLRRSHEAIKEQELQDELNSHRRQQEEWIRELEEQRQQITDSRRVTEETKRRSHQRLHRRISEEHARTSHTHRAVSYGSTMRRAGSTPNIHRVNLGDSLLTPNELGAQRGKKNSRHEKQDSSDSNRSHRQSFLNIATLGLYDKVKSRKAKKKKDSTAGSSTHTDGSAENLLSSEIEVTEYEMSTLQREHRERSKSSGDLLEGDFGAGLGESNLDRQPVTERLHRRRPSNGGPTHTVASPPNALMVVHPRHRNMHVGGVRGAHSYVHLNRAQHSEVSEYTLMDMLSNNREDSVSPRQYPLSPYYGNGYSPLGSGSSPGSHSRQGSGIITGGHSHGSSLDSTASAPAGSYVRAVEYGRQGSLDSQMQLNGQWQNNLPTIESQPTTPRHDTSFNFGQRRPVTVHGRSLSNPGSMVMSVPVSYQVDQLSATVNSMVNDGHPDPALVDAVHQLVINNSMSVGEFAQRFMPSVRGAGADYTYTEDYFGVQQALIGFLSDPEVGNAESMVIALKNIFGDGGVIFIQQMLGKSVRRERRISSPNEPGYRHVRGGETQI